MIKYVIKKGTTTSIPTVSKFCVKENTLQIIFRLGESFSQLYENTDNSTHKLIGFSDLLGSNSLRLGVRRTSSLQIYNPKEIVPVAYQHLGGKSLYPRVGKFNLEVKKLYQSIIFKNLTTKLYTINLQELNENRAPIGPVAEYPTLVNINTICKRLQGPWIEVGSQKSLWDLDFEMEYKLL